VECSCRGIRGRTIAAVARELGVGTETFRNRVCESMLQLSHSRGKNWPSSARRCGLWTMQSSGYQAHQPNSPPRLLAGAIATPGVTVALCGKLGMLQGAGAAAPMAPASSRRVRTATLNVGARVTRITHCRNASLRRFSERTTSAVNHLRTNGAP
jgi:hypothetical protein